MAMEKIFTGVTQHGMPVRVELQWPFHRSEGGSDWYVVHGRLWLADGGDLHADTVVDTHVDAGGIGGDALHSDAGAADGQVAHGQTPHGEQGSSSLFAMISFRTVVAAMAFFGLIGLAAESAAKAAV